MKTVVNLTPHVVRVRRPDGSMIEYPPCGSTVRVRAEYVGPDEDGVFDVKFGEVTGLPIPQFGTLYVVSALAAQAAGRPDVVSPATGHPKAERDASGQPFAVPGFVRA